MQISGKRQIIGKDYLQIQERFKQLSSYELQQVTQLQLINSKDYFTTWVQKRRQKYNKEVDAGQLEKSSKQARKQYMQLQYWRDHQQMSQLFYSSCFDEHFGGQLAHNLIPELIAKCSNIQSFSLTCYHGFYDLDFFQKIALSINSLPKLEKVRLKICGNIHLYLWGGKNWTQKLKIKPQIAVQSGWVVE